MPTRETLVGCWQLLRCESPLEIEPGTQMHFAADASLDYVIPTATGDLRVPLRWTIAGATLTTCFDDGSNETQVTVSIGAADVLCIDFGGPRAWYVRRS